MVGCGGGGGVEGGGQPEGWKGGKGCGAAWDWSPRIRAERHEERAVEFCLFRQRKANGTSHTWLAARLGGIASWSGTLPLAVHC